MTGFASCVRFKVKPGSRDTFLSKIKEFKLPSGALTHTAFSTGENAFCTMVTWQSESDLANARPNMISFLDTVRDLLEEISPELGVTDPVSGPVVFEEKV